LGGKRKKREKGRGKKERWHITKPGGNKQKKREKGRGKKERGR